MKRARLAMRRALFMAFLAAGRYWRGTFPGYPFVQNRELT